MLSRLQEASLSTGLGQPVFLLALLVVLKIGIDVRAHKKEHRRDENS